MRASVHMKLPNTTIDGTDTRLREVCRPLEVVAFKFCCVPQFNMKRKLISNRTSNNNQNQL